MCLLGSVKETIEVKLHTNNDDIFLNKYIHLKVLQWLEPYVNVAQEEN